MMYYTEKERAMERHRQREAKGRLVREFIKLFNYKQSGELIWKGSVPDLMEVAHLAYHSGNVCDGNGRVCTFKYIVSRTCLLLNIKEPNFPRQIAYRAEVRKGIRETTFLERYCRIIEINRDECNVLARYVEIVA